MVDFESYSKFGPTNSQLRAGNLTPESDSDECGCYDCQQNEELRKKFRTRFDDESNQKGEWDAEQYILCPPRILGYILRDKQWAQLQVTNLEEIPKKEASSSWEDRLKLADGSQTKKIIYDLVATHGMENEKGETSVLKVDDIVADKGKGLVMLLYGKRSPRL